MNVASLTASPQRLTGRHTAAKQGEIERVQLIVKKRPGSFVKSDQLISSPTSTKQPSGEIDYILPILPRRLRTRDAGLREDAAVLQIWEGTVLQVDSTQQIMRAALHAKHGEFEDQVGDIHFEWVMDQDRDLMKPGAVFYLTLYKNRRPGGTLVNSQELRFRRLPAWTREQVAHVATLAEDILRKVRPRPLAE